MADQMGDTMGTVQSIVDYLQAHAAAVAAVIGIVTPAVTAVVQRPTWSKRARIVVAAVVAVVVGTLTAAATGQITNPGDLLLTLVIVYGASEAAYEKLWQPTGAAGRIEVATTPTPTVA